MRKAGGHRGSRRTAAPAALIAAAATLIAQAWTTSHDVAVRHVRCAEHGELTHVAPAPAATAPPVAAPGARAAAVAPAGDRAPCGHHHCTVAPALRDGAGPPAARAAISIVPPPAAATAPGRRIVPARGRAHVLANAPKTSPPPARA
jgi:hypothetical protein